MIEKNIVRNVSLLFFVLIQFVAAPVKATSIIDLSIGDIPNFTSDKVIGAQGTYSNLLFGGVSAHFQITKTLPLFIGVQVEYGEKVIDEFNHKEDAGLTFNDKIHLLIVEPTISYEIRLPLGFNFYPGIGIAYAYCLNKTEMDIYNGVIENGQVVYKLAGNADVRFSDGFLLFVPKIKISRKVYKKFSIASYLEIIRFERDLGNLQVTYTAPESKVYVIDNSQYISIKSINIGLIISCEL
jgi:hypothetical protein